MADETQTASNANDEPQPDRAEPHVDADADLEETEQAIQALREEIGRATTNALVALESEYGVEGETELYEKMGFETETVTLELDVTDPEFLVLVDTFDQLTRGKTRAEDMLVGGRIFEQLLDELDPEMAHRWVTDGLREFAWREA